MELLKDWFSIFPSIVPIAQLLASIATVVALFIAVRQLKQNAELAKATNSQSLVDSLIKANSLIVQDRSLVELHYEGLRHYDKMDEIKKAQYERLSMIWLVIYNSIYHQNSKGLLDKETFEAWEKSLRVTLAYPATRPLWDRLKENFEESFRNYIEKVSDEEQPKVE